MHGWKIASSQGHDSHDAFHGGDRSKWYKMISTPDSFVSHQLPEVKLPFWSTLRVQPIPRDSEQHLAIPLAPHYSWVVAREIGFQGSDLQRTMWRYGSIQNSWFLPFWSAYFGLNRREQKGLPWITWPIISHMEALFPWFCACFCVWSLNSLTIVQLTISRFRCSFGWWCDFDLVETRPEIQTCEVLCTHRFLLTVFWGFLNENMYIPKIYQMISRIFQGKLT